MNPRDLGQHTVNAIKEGATGGDRAWASLTADKKTQVRARAATKGVTSLFWGLVAVGVSASGAVHFPQFWYAPAAIGLLAAFYASASARTEFDRAAKELS